MAYRNQEHYSDPTAGTAMGQAMREYRTQQKENWKRKHEIKNRNKVYVVSRYAGDIAKNVETAIRCCRFVIEQGKMPLASHLIYPQMLRDEIPEEREMGTLFGLALLRLCDEVWIFKDHNGLSPGMAAEEQEARRLEKPIRYYNPEVIP